MLLYEWTREKHNRSITIINTYAPCPATEKIDFYRHVNHVIEEITRNNDTDIILAGDLNSVMDNRKDIIAGEKHNGREVEALQDLILNTDLNDVWRLQHEDQREYTWSRNNPFIARRLDYIFTSSALLPYVESSEIKSTPFSDHRLVKIEIKFNHFKKRPILLEIQ